MQCSICQITDEEKIIKKCPICFKLICEDCSYRLAGRHFCCKGCGEIFFFGIGDEDEDDD